MTRLQTIFFFLVFACNIHLQAQDDFYSLDSVQEIRISFHEENWKYLLDSLFLNTGDEGRLIGNATINGISFNNVGVRYKGFSSWNSGEIKNPLNIDLDYTLSDQNYKGHTKLKLSNVIHDPSFVREVLSYEIARKYMPASRANFAAVFINNAYIGLYTNVEAVDKKFVEAHFLSSANSFFKGEQETLQFPFGQNANLAYTHGDDSSGYMPYYKLESEYGWNDMFHLIKVLNNNTDSLNSILNIDRTLWMHAFNYTLLNLDSYIGYAQNYYLLRDNAGRFNPILWDLNMSFGSFRSSDGSSHFLGLTIPELKILDPLQHLDFSISPRPLMSKLFANETFRRMYLAHIRTIVEENIGNNLYFDRAIAIQAVIKDYVATDTNKFYSYNDFLNNTTSTVGGSGQMIEYPGLKDLMEARAGFLKSYAGYNGAPVITSVTHNKEMPEKGEDFWITARISEASDILLFYRTKNDAAFESTPMFDDGLHNDGVAGDSRYGAGISASGNIIHYYLYAENKDAGIFAPERAGYEFFTIYPAISAGVLAINEVKVASEENADQLLLPSGWIELYNKSDEMLNLRGCYLVSDHNPGNAFAFPDTIINPHEYMLLCSDGSISAHMFNTGYVLSAPGGNVVLYNGSDKPIDSISYSTQVVSKSIGRYPNGYGSFMYMIPTAFKQNLPGMTPETGFLLFPNPARTVINLEYTKINTLYNIEIHDITGRSIYAGSFAADDHTGLSTLRTLDISSLNNGLYFITITGENVNKSRKFIVY